MKKIEPVSGRIFVIKHGDVYTMTGVLRFSAGEFLPVELGGYTMAVNGQSRLVSVISKMHAPAPEGAYSLEACMKRAMWRIGADKGVELQTIRFVHSPVAPDTYNFLVMVTEDPFRHHPFYADFASEKGYFVDIMYGAVHPCPKQEASEGMTAIDALKRLPVWPASGGKFTTATDLSTAGRAYLKGMQELKLADLRNKRALNVVESNQTTATFDDYLLVAQEFDMLLPPGMPMTEEDLQKHKQFVQLAIAARRAPDSQAQAQYYQLMERLAGKKPNKVTTD